MTTPTRGASVTPTPFAVRSLSRMINGLSAVRAPRGWALAACLNVDPEAFFPEKGFQTPAAVKVAKNICATCPARQACLDFAMESREKYGIWGGMTAKERKALRAEQNTEMRELARASR